MQASLGSSSPGKKTTYTNEIFLFSVVFIVDELNVADASWCWEIE